MTKICFVTAEIAPFSSGGIGVLIRNLLTTYTRGAHTVHVLYMGETPVDSTTFGVFFPDVKLWQLPELLPASEDLAVHPPYWAFSTHPWHFKSYQVANALKQLEAQSVVFDYIEFPDWGGLGFCSIQEKLLDQLNAGQIAVRIHSTDSVLRPGQPVVGGEAAANISDLERKSLRDADLIVAHVASVAHATARHFGFSEDWIKNVVINAPPVLVDSINPTITFGADTPICFPSKIQELKRPEVFLRGALAFIETCSEYHGDVIFLAHPTDAKLAESLKNKVPSHLADRVKFITDAPRELRQTIVQSSIGVFPSPFESFCLAAYENSLAGGITILNGANPAFDDLSAWVDRRNCLKFDGTALGLAEALSAAWHDRTSLSLEPVYCPPSEHPYWFTQSPTVSRQFDTNETPLVSVIIPYYNMGAYIRATLESVLLSTYENLEVIIVNDGSPDPLSKIVLDKLRDTQRFDIVKIVDAPTNLGLPGARNLGIRAAKGDFIFTIDADDLIHPCFVELAVRALLKNPRYSVVVPQTAFVSDESVAAEMRVVDYALFTGEAVSAGCVANRFSTATSLGRREVYAQFPYDEYLNSYEDWDFYSRLVRAGHRFIVTSDIYFYYRRRANSMISENSRDRHVRNISTIRSKQRFSIGATTLDLSILVDAEAELHSRLDRLTHVGKAEHVDTTQAKDEYIQVLRAQVAHQDALLRSASEKLNAIDTVVAALREGLHSSRPTEQEVRPTARVGRRVGIATIERWLSEQQIRRQRRQLLKTDFDPRWYLENNPDVAAAGVDPARHYILHGKAEGRLAHSGAKK